jgi:hypothetical protein
MLMVAIDFSWQATFRQTSFRLTGQAAGGSPSMGLGVARRRQSARARAQHLAHRRERPEEVTSLAAFVMIRTIALEGGVGHAC